MTQLETISQQNYVSYEEERMFRASRQRPFQLKLWSINMKYLSSLCTVKDSASVCSSVRDEVNFLFFCFIFISKH